MSDTDDSDRSDADTVVPLLTPSISTTSIAPSTASDSNPPQIYARNYTYYCSYVYYPRAHGDSVMDPAAPHTHALVDNLTIPEGYSYSCSYSYHVDEVGFRHPRDTEVPYLPPVPSGYYLQYWRVCWYTSIPGVTLPFWGPPALPEAPRGDCLARRERSSSWSRNQEKRDQLEEKMIKRTCPRRPREMDHVLREGLALTPEASFETRMASVRIFCFFVAMFLLLPLVFCAISQSIAQGHRTG